MKPRWPRRAQQVIHGAAHFNCIARTGCQWLVHVGQQRGSLHTGTIAYRHDTARQLPRFFDCRHERARTHFYIHDQRIQSSSELLGEDGCRNQRDGFDRRRDVTGCVDTLVCRRQFCGLADDGDPRIAHNLLEFLDGNAGLVAGDGIEFVQRTAGMAQTAARDHRHEATACRKHWSHHERYHVAHTASRMLVDNWSRQVERFPVEHRAGIAHGQRQRHSFG